MSQYKRRVKMLTDLRKRNDFEKRFEGIVQLCVSLRENVDFLEKENGRLSIQQARLEADNINSENASDNKVNQPVLKKIYDLQTELAELHKNKGDHAEEIIELRRNLDKKEREMKLLTERFDIAKSALGFSQANKMHYEEKAFEASNNLQLVQDEYAALLLTYSSLKNNTEKLDSEHQDLLSRWEIYKVKATTDSNVENKPSQSTIEEVNTWKEMDSATNEPIDTPLES